MELATRNAAEMLAREQARWLADQGKTLGALEELADALELPVLPARIECYDISNFQGTNSVGEHGRLRGRQATDGGVPPLRDQDRRGPERRRAPPARSCAAASANAKPGDEGSRRGAPLGDAGPRDHRRRPVPGRRGEGRPRRAGPARPAAGRPGEGARGAGAPGPRRARCSCRRPRRPSTSSSGSATRRTGSRSPITAKLRAQGLGPIGVRRPARHRPAAPRRGPAADVRLGQASPRGPGRADRRRARASARRWPPGSRTASSPDRPLPTGAEFAAGTVPRLYHPPSCAEPAPILIAVIGLLALVIDFWPNLYLPGADGADSGAAMIETKLGPRPSGRAEGRVSRQSQRRQDADPRPTSRSSRQIIERRVNSTGVSEPVVVTSGTDRIVVEVPGVSDTAGDPEARRPDRQARLRAGAELRLRHRDGSRGPRQARSRASRCPRRAQPLFGGDQIDSANVEHGPAGQARAVELHPEVGRRQEPVRGLDDAPTSTSQFAIVLDNDRDLRAGHPERRSPAARSRSAAPARSAASPQKDAEDLVNVLRFGSLPFPVEELVERHDRPDARPGVPERAASSPAASRSCSCIFFMLIHYRLPGAVASFALLYYALVAVRRSSGSSR